MRERWRAVLLGAVVVAAFPGCVAMYASNCSTPMPTDLSVQRYELEVHVETAAGREQIVRELRCRPLGYRCIASHWSADFDNPTTERVRIRVPKGDFDLALLKCAAAGSMGTDHDALPSWPQGFLVVDGYKHHFNSDALAGASALELVGLRVERFLVRRLPD